MTLHIHDSIYGPHVVCDKCNTKFNLPHNCGWGKKFIKPSLAKLGMRVNTPHVCKGCKEIKNAAA